MTKSVQFITLCILSFILPIVGLYLYLRNGPTKESKAYLICSVIGFLVLMYLRNEILQATRYFI